MKASIRSLLPPFSWCVSGSAGCTHSGGLSRSATCTGSSCESESAGRVRGATSPLEKSLSHFSLKLNSDLLYCLFQQLRSYSTSYCRLTVLTPATTTRPETHERVHKPINATHTLKPTFTFSINLRLE